MATYGERYNPKNDGFGRMTHYSRFSGSYVTEYRPDGYYWAYSLATKEGGATGFTGPYPTRQDAGANVGKRLKRAAK